ALEEFVGNDLRMAEDGNFGLDISQLVEDPSVPGGRLLRTSYPEGSASRGTDGPDGGMQAYLELQSPTDVLDLTYQVRFPEGFDFVKGGKLPGLYGGSENNGGKVPDGTDGFSTRYMWRSGGEGEVYAYLPTSEEHGTSLGRGCWSFVPGSWTTVRQRVQLNTPGTADGRITVWQDGRMVLDKGGLDFRSTDELRIDGVFFSTFFGGGDESWASPSDQHAEFAAFEVAADSAAPPGQPPVSADDGDCGTPRSS
ncbi:MAG: polysaccharide lyase, partial [Pseudonocardia sp.]